MRLARFVIPCRQIRVEVRYGEAEGLSVAEQMLLRGVAAGAATLRDLENLLGLPPRMVMDLCIEMLHGGFLQVERPSGRLHASEPVVAAIGDPLRPNADWARAFASPTPPPPMEVTVFQDCVSGALFLPPPRAWEPGSFDRAPVNPELEDPADVLKADLMLVVANATTREGPSENDPTGGAAGLRPRRIIDVAVKRLQMPTGADVAAASDTSPASILVTARCVRAVPDDESVREPGRVTILEPREIPRTVRRRIANGLVRLADRGIGIGANQFFDTLAYDDGDDDEALAQALAVDTSRLEGDLSVALRDVAKSLPSSEMHARLADLDETARHVVGELARNRGDVQVVAGAAAHRAAAVRALTEATVQVVLGCPWMRRLGEDAEISDAMRLAVGRGVRVHLLWGVSADAKIDEAIGGAGLKLIAELNSAGEASGGRVVVPDRPCSSHAKLIVRDLDWMVVGSANFLNAPADRTTDELGLLVRSASIPDTSAALPTACALVIDALKWCHSISRDFHARTELVVEPVFFGRAEPCRSVAVADAVVAPAESGVAEWQRDLTRKMWAAQWESRIAAHVKELAAVRGSPLLLTDADHRRLLFESMARATRRLVIASPRLGIGLLGSAALPALAKAVERAGLSVVVAHSGEPPTSPQERQRLADERPQLREMQRKGLQIRRWDSHCKLVVCDDVVAIGSFNFLSFEGYYESSGRARREMSVQVKSADLADALWNRLQSEGSITTE